MAEIDSLDFEDARYERKFLVSELSLEEIEQIIKFHPAIFLEIFFKRRVNNIYFDSINMENYFDNVRGNPQRLKIRIRWYGVLGGKIKNPFLELKVKSGELGKKLKFPLKSFSLNKNFSKEFLQKEVFNKSNLPNWLIEKLKLYQPCLLNSYKRKYFISTNKEYRITLDDDLVFFEIKEKNNLFKYKRQDRSIVLEVKYKRSGDEFVEKITQLFSF